MDDFESRKRARKNWSVRKTNLDDSAEDLSQTTTAAERISMMWPLAVEATRLAGLEIPDYDRKHTPGRLIRPTDPNEKP